MITQITFKCFLIIITARQAGSQKHLPTQMDVNPITQDYIIIYIKKCMGLPGPDLTSLFRLFWLLLVPSRLEVDWPLRSNIWGYCPRVPPLLPPPSSAFLQVGKNLNCLNCFVRISFKVGQDSLLCTLRLESMTWLLEINGWITSHGLAQWILYKLGKQYFWNKVTLPVEVRFLLLAPTHLLLCVALSASVVLWFEEYEL